MDNAPTPSRLRLARERRGFTKVGLAALAEISSKMVYEYETGRAIPPESTVANIARALRFPEAFFYRNDLEPPTPLSASFRSLRAMTAGRRDAALAAGALAFEISGWIVQRFRIPAPDIPDLRGYDPEGAAMALRRLWGIGEKRIGNVVHLLEAQGVRVFSLDEHRTIDAYSLWHQGVPYVCLNTVKTAEHARMDAAHELGHLVLHRFGSDWNGDVEREAQAFASAFLMPKASVLAAPKLGAPTLMNLALLKKRWGVSAAALAHRLHALKIVSDWHYHVLCVALAKFGRTREPLPHVERESSQVMVTLFGSPSGTVTRAAMAADLGLPVRDVELLTFGIRGQAAEAARSAARATASSSPGALRVVGGTSTKM